MSNIKKEIDHFYTIEKLIKKNKKRRKKRKKGKLKDMCKVTLISICRCFTYKKRK